MMTFLTYLSATLGIGLGVIASYFIFVTLVAAVLNKAEDLEDDDR